MNRSRALSLLYVAPFLAAVAWLFLPVILGRDTLFARDVFNTHLPMKWFQAEAMAAGELPLIDPARSGGQPHLGNPNTVPLYPDNLLYLIASPVWALNAHFWLHLLLAPLAVCYLARRIGMGWAAAWSAGVFYATSGYYLSTMNLYNLTAATTLTPAFLGACIELGREGGSRRGLPLAAGLWALLVLGGDPMSAVTALLAGAAATGGGAARRGPAVGRLATSVALGTLVAAPQVVEFLRIVPGSYRGIQGYTVQAATAASWSPANLFEWLVPMAFGAPDLLYWGERFHAGRLPLFYSLYPGLLVLALAFVGSRRERPWIVWSWSLVVVGVFFAMGSYNPIASWILGLPGMRVFRLPVKLWVLVGCGLAILAGLGLQRFLDGRGEVRLRRALAAAGAVLALFGLTLALAGDRAQSLVGGLLPARIPPEHAEIVVRHWMALAFASVAFLGLALLVTRGGGRRRLQAGGWLLALHVAGQALFLSALVPTDSVAALTRPSQLLRDIPTTARVVHGDSGGIFGRLPISVADYPDARLKWLQRDTFEQLYPPAGLVAGRRYEFWSSPEGLDSFLTRTATQALPLLDDPRRLSILEASGVTHLLLSRDLDGVLPDRVRLVRRSEVGSADLRLYALLESAKEVQFVGRVLRAPDARQTLLLMTDPTFDAATAVVLQDDGSPSLGGSGVAELVEASSEELTVRVSAASPGAVVFQRSFLPIYVAELDGEPVDIALANLHRMAVEVPQGEHLLTLRVEGRSVTPAFVVSGLGLLLLALRARRRDGEPADAAA